MLRWRLASAAVILAVVLSIVVLDFRCVYFGVPGAWLLPLVLLISGMGAWEVLSLLKAGGFQPRAKLTTFLAILVTLSFCEPVIADFLSNASGIPRPRFGWPMCALTAAVIIILSREVLRYSGNGIGIVSAALAIYVVVYIGALLGFLALLRCHVSNAWGMTALVSMLTITKLSDTGAYFTGRAFGRHKMSPMLSPGKTMEGAIGGILFACLGSWAFFAFIGAQIVGPDAAFSWWRCFLYGGILAVTGMFGDLAESMLKREMHCKDSSKWLPGLGGVLDIIDSVLFAAPAAYLCWVLKLVGP